MLGSRAAHRHTANHRTTRTMSNIDRNDLGEPLDQYQTKGDYNMYLVGSALQKAIRRGDREVAMNAALELVRSGYEGFFHSRVSYIIRRYAAPSK